MGTGREKEEMTTSLYYGKKYRLVFGSASREKINFMAHIIQRYLKQEYGVQGKNGKVVGRKKAGLPGMVLFVNHLEKADGKVIHQIFVKIPYDKVIQKIKK
jgi:hypothetical protein